MKTSHAGSGMVGPGRHHQIVQQGHSHPIRRSHVPHPAMSPNSVAVITGGASGIGLAAAIRFARLGMKVCIADLGGKADAGRASGDDGDVVGGHGWMGHVSSPW